MSTLFYDHLLQLDKVEKSVTKVSKTHDEKIELWSIIDELIHHRVFGCILENLPKESHKEFLELFHKSPHDAKLLDYLRGKIKKDVGLLIKEAVSVLVLELIQDIELPKKISRSRR